jgi:hypothetical protein
MGHVLVAQSGILPGAELFTDKAIVEFCGPFSCLKPVDTVVFSASFMESNGTDQLEKLMALPVKYPCPSVCAIRCELESAAHNLGLGGLRKYTPRDIEQLLHYVCVLRQKSVDLPCGRSLVYGTAGMLYSSCDPNCHLTISEDGWCICRASSFISAGDVLTVAFTECLCVAGTPNRRNFLLYGKDFTCHCVRCDAVRRRAPVQLVQRFSVSRSPLRLRAQMTHANCSHTIRQCGVRGASPAAMYHLPLLRSSLVPSRHVCARRARHG